MNERRRGFDLLSGERQVAEGIEGIRRDHVERYHFAASRLWPHRRVLDVACGVGYGTHYLATRGHTVTGADASLDAIEYARRYYRHPEATYVLADASKPFDCLSRPYEAVVCFETIEHLYDPAVLLRQLNAPMLFASVPNERVFPYTGQAFHFRHYTRDEFESLLTDCGWQVRKWYGQRDTEAAVDPDLDGWTLIVEARRGFRFGEVPSTYSERKNV